MFVMFIFSQTDTPEYARVVVLWQIPPVSRAGV